MKSFYFNLIVEKEFDYFKVFINEFFMSEILYLFFFLRTIFFPFFITIKFLSVLLFTFNSFSNYFFYSFMYSQRLEFIAESLLLNSF